MTSPRNPKGWGAKATKWNGMWRSYLTLGYDDNGKAQRKYVYGRTRKDCLEAVDALRLKHHLGGPQTSNITVNQYLTDWLSRKATEVSPRTIDEYERELGHARPHIGKKKLVDLKPLDVQRMMIAISKTTWTVGPKGGEYQKQLTPRAANQARVVLHNALDEAVRFGIIGTNPARLVKPLRHQPEEFKVWTAAEITSFLSATSQGAAHHALFYLALTAGLRPGELIALTWQDLRGDSLRVDKTLSRAGGRYYVGPPKTRASRRTLPLSPDTLKAIEVHEQGLAEADITSELMFPTRNGTMLLHGGLIKSLHVWADSAKVPRIRVHDLRHTYASMAIASGMNPADLARQLGHTDASFTMRRYVHFFEQARPREAASLAQLLGAAG